MKCPKCEGEDIATNCTENCDDFPCSCCDCGVDFDSDGNIDEQEDND